ncbi:MAG: hypothetical protein PUP91_03990 [Rhizonema sp. PD37]|nr:hypothetical protein [Rhizonema sp. PD37]
MTIKPIILISSLLVSAGANVTTFTEPAQAFITQFTTSFPQDIIGYTRTFTDTQGRDLTSISLNSPSFPFTSFTGNGTSSLTANFFGGAIPANTPFTIFTNIADPPGSFSVTNTNTAYVLNKGVISQIPTFSAGFICSTQGGGTPYQAVQLSVGGNPAGFVECQGNTVGRINQTTTPFTESISVKPISGYQPISDLGTFPPAITVTENPGVNPSVARTNAAVPEPSGILGTLAFGIMVAVYRLKRQSKKVTV